jgi:hypothetical protein
MTDAAATTTKAAPKKPDSPPATPEVPAVHAAAGDITTTGPAAMLSHEPKESDRQREGRELREKLGFIVRTLRIDAAGPMKSMGAGLMATHMAQQLGLEAAATMTEPEVRAFAADFRSRYPAAWGAACAANVMHFVRFVKVAGLRKAETVEATQQMVVEYQSGMSTLAAS